MSLVQDILLDENNDLRIEGGDFVFGPSDDQHVALIFNTYLGDWKQFPLCGLGIEAYLSSPNTKEVLRRDATVQLKADGFKVDELDIQNDGPDKLIITPIYTRIKTK